MPSQKSFLCQLQQNKSGEYPFMYAVAHNYIFIALKQCCLGISVSLNIVRSITETHNVHQQFSVITLFNQYF